MRAWPIIWPRTRKGTATGDHHLQSEAQVAVAVAVAVVVAVAVAVAGVEGGHRQ